MIMQPVKHPPPADWKVQPLREVVSRVTRRNAIKETNVLTISARDGLVSQEEFFHRRVASSDLSSYFLLQNGDFAYNKSYSAGFPVGVIRRLDHYSQGVVSPLYICFRAIDSRVNSDYLDHYFQSGLLDEEMAWIAKEGARNHGLLNVGVDDFLAIPVHLPPHEEQISIARALDVADKMIRSSQHLIEKLERVEQSILHDLICRGVDGEGHLRDPNLLVDSPLGPKPHQWRLVRLGDVAKVTSGSTPSRSVEAFWRRGTVPWVRTAEIDFATINDTAEKISKIALNSVGLKIHPVGTVLVAMYGEGATRGRSAILGIAATVNQACAAIYGDQAVLSQRFLFHYLRANYRRLRSLGHGSQQTNLSGTLIEDLPVLLPTINEQERVSDALGHLDERSGRERQTLNKQRLLRQGLMTGLLTGRVRMDASI